MITRISTLSHPLWCALSILSLTFSATAQCDLSWQPGSPAGDPIGQVWSLTALPNGSLLAGGRFEVAGSEQVSNVALHDGTAWRALGGGVTGTVFATTALPNGDVIVAGDLTAAGGNPVSNIARWNGTAWSDVGGGTSGRVSELGVLANGDLVVSGSFTVAGNMSVDRIATWDGSTWSSLAGGPGLSAGPLAMTVAANGDVIVGGNGTQGSPDIMSWDGVSWSQLPGLPAAPVTAVTRLLAMPNGDLAIAAHFQPSGQRGLAIWDGTQLMQSPLPQPISVSTLAADTNGDLLVGSGPTAFPPSVPPVFRYDGSIWTVLGSNAPAAVNSIVVDANGTILIGSITYGLDPYRLSSVAQLSGGEWLPIDSLVPGRVLVVQELPNGDVVAGGEFDEIGGVAANNIARWNGSTWTPLGQGVNGRVAALAVSPDGTLLVGGDFTTAGGAPIWRLARWNGLSWNTVGAGLNAVPSRLATNDSGEVMAIVAHANAVRFYDGQSWTVVTPPPGLPADVVAMPNGDFVIGGFFILQVAPFGIMGAMRLVNGALVSEPGANNFLTKAMTLSNDGELVLAGAVAGSSAVIARIVNGVASTITPLLLPGSSPFIIDFMPNGDLILAGAFEAIGPQSIPGIGRWDGNTWSTIDGGITLGKVDSVAISGRGELFVAGSSVQVVGGAVSIGLARATTPCPAAAITFGAGCVGSAGPLTLAPTSLPWLGSVFESTAQSLSAQSLAVHVIGINATVLPLPLGAPGCSLFVDPLQLALLVPQNGQVQTSFSVPTDLALVGQSIFTQVVGLELDAGLGLQQLTSSNALQLTVGSF